MPRRDAEREDESDGWDADYDESDVDDGDDDDNGEHTVACPYCRRQIHEDSQRCPECGQYISEEDRPAASQRWWVIAGVVLGLLAGYSWFVR